jgi:predicted outer membrane repeat protein
VHAQSITDLQLTAIEGFTISGANHHGLLIDSSAITLERVRFIANQAGYDSQGTPLSPSYGGAMYISGLADPPAITTCEFSGNRARAGGAVYSAGISPTFTECTFSSNFARLPAGNDDQFFNAKGGGAWYIAGGDGSISPLLRRCHLTNNNALSSNGGAIFAASVVDLLDSVFESNTATGGQDPYTLNDEGGNGGAAFFDL